MLFRAFLLTMAAASLFAADKPKLFSITPSTRPIDKDTVDVKLAGEGFSAGGVTIVVAPDGAIQPLIKGNDDTTITATFKVLPTVTGTVDIAVTTVGGTSGTVKFDTNRIAEGTIDIACPAQGDRSKPACNQLKWEVDGNASSLTNSQTNTKTVPNVVFKLDYLLRAAHAFPDPEFGGKIAPKGLGERFVSHLIFRTGFTQAAVADKLQPVQNTPGSSNSNTAPTTCPSGTSAASASGSAGGSGSGSTPTCTALTGQQAFLVEAGGTMGWTIHRDGAGSFAEAGLAARGSFQSLLSQNQIVHTTDTLLADLKTNNPRQAIGAYEAVGRFRLAQFHDKNSFDPSKNAFTKNVEDLLVLEAGYQNNSALARLLPQSPQTNTRNRFVGRFYAFPELNDANHTRVLFGIEYNGGWNGGPKDIKIFYGLSLDPAKLLNPDQKNQ